MDLKQALFSPLGKEYCLYFYILSVVGLVFVVVVLLSALVIGVSKRKGLDFYFTAIIGSLGYAIFYFQNRLLYSMCVASA